MFLMDFYSRLTVKLLLLSALFLGVMGKTHADQACTDCHIKVLFKGFYTDETCKVSINNAGETETVILPKISTSALVKEGNEAGSQPFNISLKECPVSRTVRVKFLSNLYAADVNTGNLTNSAGDLYSQNVQVRIRKENSAQVKIDDDVSGQDYLIPPSGEEVTHTFYASYYASMSSAVTPGIVKTAAGIELIYK